MDGCIVVPKAAEKGILMGAIIHLPYILMGGIICYNPPKVCIMDPYLWWVGSWYKGCTPCNNHRWCGDY